MKRKIKGMQSKKVYNKKVSRRIKEVRKAKGHKHVGIKELTGQNIGLMEMGTSGITVYKVYRYCHTIGVPMDEFFKGMA